ncbi:MAG: UDP-3-O-acyl-N-acetylglucosamine deacetylase [Legionellales bacterium]|jgi:UDP-3-O-[3-hydroxymyristoyl] N-acetylglucosamine deacetylase|nr:UDP-3-O-acyl-N-acetylglucosamine deacetylase [Legionellales bacterium]
MTKQRTISNEISCRGIGLHTGLPVLVKFMPAAENTGIVFRRVDLDPVVDVAADVWNVGDTRLSTCLIKDGVRVATIEHLMSAISALGIDNLLISLNAAEVPIMDGSAAPFIFLLQSAGIVLQKELKRFIRVTKKVSVTGEHGEYSCFEPSDKSKFNISMEFTHPHKCFSTDNCGLGFELSSVAFQKEISRARTFGFLHQYEELRRNNLALGGGLHNAIVFNDYDVMNKENLRFPNEPLRHKLLDVIGDIYLAGCPIVGEFTGHKTGHFMNNKLLRKLINTVDAWENVNYKESVDMPILFESNMITA